MPVYLLVCVAAIVVYFQLGNDLPAAVLYDSLVASGALAVVVGVRRNKPRRPVLWYFCAISTVCLALGDVTYDVYALALDRDPVPVPSWADAFYLAGYPFLLVAIWGFARRRLPTSKIDTLLDAAVIALGAAIGVAGPLMAANSDESRSVAAVIVASVYPIADVGLLAAASFLALQRGLRNPATQLFIGSLVMLAIGDVAFAYLGANGYDVGAAIDVTWLAHAAFLGAAALHPDMAAISARPREKSATLSLVRASIIGLALLPLALAPVSDTVFEDVRWLELPARLVLVGVVLVRLVRLSSETERAHDEADRRAESLAMAREEIAHIVAAAADAIIGGDNNGVITAWNSGAERLLGVPASEAIGSTIDTFVAEDIAPWAEAFRNMMPGDIRSAVLPARRADGVSILVDVRLGLATTPDGNVVGFVAIARDASEALVAQSAGSAGDLEPSTVLENVRTIVGRVVDVAAVGLVAFDQEQGSYHEVLTVGDHVAIHLPDQGEMSDATMARLRDLPTVFRARDDAADVAPIASFLDRARATSGIGVTVRHATMGPIGLMLIALERADAPDATLLDTVRSLVPSLTRVARALMLAEEEETSARRTADIDSMRADFSNFVRHDMREQVAAIRSALDVLSDNKISLGDSWRERLMTNLSSSVEMLERLVGDVATAGLVIDGRFPCELREIDDLRGLICSTVDKHRGEVAQEIKVVIGDLPPIKGDAERLAQVLSHLLTNAAKFSPPSSTIAVSANFDPAQRRVRIAVRDRGVGIAPEDHSLVFRRFARIARNDEGARPEGTGLGLFIAQGIAESHGGRISLTSQLGDGSVFYIELPAERPVGVPG
ncbi:MAG TPA: PAS domain-containing sensor histidine kinase [Acidimicrobiales bacterium]|nr:PAS domain-containing sensor histidine kinase [Acidimicrobiales bacterium]